MVNGSGHWDLWLRVDSAALESGSFIWVALPRAFAALQKESASEEGYVSLSSPTTPGSATLLRLESNLDLRLPFWPFDKKLIIAEIRVDSPGLGIGDSLHLSFGGSSPEAAVQVLNSAGSDPFLLAWQRVGQPQVLAPSPPVSLLVHPAPAQTPVAFLPSVSQLGQPERLQVVLYDGWFNRSIPASVLFRVQCTDPLADWPEELSMNLADSGRLETTVRFRSPGIHYLIFTAEFSDPSDAWELEFRSNPVKVQSSPTPSIYWGEFHAHSQNSHDAYGQVSFSKARLTNCLDFFCATEHHRGGARSAGISCEEWEANVEEALREHQPGFFVPFLGYETSFSGEGGGHHNQIFAFDDARIGDIPVYVEAENMVEIWEALSTEVPANPFDAVENGLAVLSIPHHTGKNFNTALEGHEATVHFGPDAGPSTWRRVMEIYSNHGQSERFDPNDPLAYEKRGDQFSSVDGPHYAQDAWALGNRIGVIASSDDHSGRGGSPREGLFAVYSDSLERKQLFRNMVNRHTYGTTGDRILMDLSINSAGMGDVLHAPANEPLCLRVLAAGTEPLEAVWILRWDFTQGKMRNGHPVFDTLAKYSPGQYVFSDSLILDMPKDSSLYYVKVQQSSRLQQDGQAFGWSSPIWVIREPVTASVFPRFRVYPNPANDQLFLTVLECGTESTQVQVYNAATALVYEGRLSPTALFTLELDVQKLSPGWYWVRLPELDLQAAFLKVP